MGQFSVKILANTGSVLSENQHLLSESQTYRSGMANTEVRLESWTDSDLIRMSETTELAEAIVIVSRTEESQSNATRLIEELATISEDVRGEINRRSNAKISSKAHSDDTAIRDDQSIEQKDADTHKQGHSQKHSTGQAQKTASGSSKNRGNHWGHGSSSKDGSLDSISRTSSGNDLTRGNYSENSRSVTTENANELIRTLERQKSTALSASHSEQSTSQHRSLSESQITDVAERILQNKSINSETRRSAAEKVFQYSTVRSDESRKTKSDAKTQGEEHSKAHAISEQHQSQKTIENLVQQLHEARRSASIAQGLTQRAGFVVDEYMAQVPKYSWELASLTRYALPELIEMSVGEIQTQKPRVALIQIMRGKPERLTIANVRSEIDKTNEFAEESYTRFLQKNRNAHADLYMTPKQATRNWQDRQFELFGRWMRFGDPDEAREDVPEEKVIDDSDRPPSLFL